jgi:uncharacterized protein (TIGR03086 family)
MTSPATADGLLEQAVDYALRSVAAVTPGLLAGPTPCADWDLSMLLRHSCESLAALAEGVRVGCVGQAAAAGGTGCADAAGLFTARAAGLLEGWERFSRPWITIGEHRLNVTEFAAAGALEIAMHGWDVARACGWPEPIPAALADRLLAIAPLLVTDADRTPLSGPAGPARPLFGPAVTVPAGASASDRLTAFLGRTWTRGQQE